LLGNYPLTDGDRQRATLTDAEHRAMSKSEVSRCVVS